MRDSSKPKANENEDHLSTMENREWWTKVHLKLDNIADVQVREDPSNLYDDHVRLLEC